MAQIFLVLPNGAPVSPSMSPDGTNVPHAHSSAASLSHTPTNGAVQQCAGTTDLGSRCKRRIKGKNYCHSHIDQEVKAESPSATEAEVPSAAHAPRTMNNILANIPNLQLTGYYQCAGICKTTLRCKRHLENRTYCHDHHKQLLDAVSHNNDDKAFVARTIAQIKNHNGPIDDKLADIRASLLLCRKWSETHVNNLVNLLRNIKKVPLETSERVQGPHAPVPMFDYVYKCRGHTRVGRRCCNRVVGAFYCRHHDPERGMARDVEMAFAAI